MSNLEFNCDNLMSLDEAIKIGEKYKHRQFLLKNDPQLQVCRGCDRLTRAIYCCGSCERAFMGKYEIHEDGILGHTESCNVRHKTRSFSIKNNFDLETGK